MGAWVEASLSKIESTGRDSNPRHRITGAVSLPLDDQCLLFSVGPEGLEPSPARLSAGDAAANTLVPSIESARWHDLRLIRTPLSPPELRASESRVGGNRTHAVRIKSPLCCQLHHNPKRRSGVCVSIDEVGTSLGSCLFGCQW